MFRNCVPDYCEPPYGSRSSPGGQLAAADLPLPPPPLPLLAHSLAFSNSQEAQLLVDAIAEYQQSLESVGEGLAASPGDAELLEVGVEGWVGLMSEHRTSDEVLSSDALMSQL